MLFEVKNKSIDVFEITALDFPLHLHTHIEVLICTDGTFEVSCNNQEQTLCEGDIMISFPNDIHSYTKTEFGKGIMIIFDPYISELITSTLNKEQYSNFLHDEEVVPLSIELYHYSQSSANFHVIYGYLHIIFGMVLRKISFKNSNLPVSVFDAAIRYIAHNYTKSITLKKISQKVGVSQSHLSRVFAEKIEGGFNNYLKILRIERAKNLLLTTDLNIYEILLESGFSDQRTFNRVFKRMTNMTPREYRKIFQSISNKKEM